MKTIELNGNPIDYDVLGSGDTTIVLMTGWCQDHRLYKNLAPLLAEKYRVVIFDWRGHGSVHTVDSDFGVDEQVSDVLALLDALGVDKFIPVSHSHGGWVNLELTDRLGADRIARSIHIDQIMQQGNDEFIASLRASQDPAQWEAGRQELFDLWVADRSCEDVNNHVENEMTSWGFDMWARSCKVIERAYTRWGSPLGRMEAIADHRPIMHLYTQLDLPAYHQLQRDFAAKNPWFEPVHIPGITHFPTLESAPALAVEIERFVGGVA